MRRWPPDFITRAGLHCGSKLGVIQTAWPLASLYFEPSSPHPSLIIPSLRAGIDSMGTVVRQRLWLFCAGERGRQWGDLSEPFKRRARRSFLIHSTTLWKCFYFLILFFFNRLSFLYTPGTRQTADISGAPLSR